MYSVRVETVSGMSTDVDVAMSMIFFVVETVSGMSTDVDLSF